MTAETSVQDFLQEWFEPAAPDARLRTITPAADSPIEDFLAFLEPPRPERTDEPTVLECRDALVAIDGADAVFCMELAVRSSPAFVATLLGSMSRRARFVRDHILRFRSVTAWEVMKDYANETAAVNDLVQAGIPLKTTIVRAENGRPTTQYTFAPEVFEHQRQARGFVPNRLQVIAGEKCALCPSSVDHFKRTLQVDHRVPFALVGNQMVEDEGHNAVQPLCPSHNTAKQHACKACPNFAKKTVQECRSCYWAYPEQYTHVAGRRERRLTIVATEANQETALNHLKEQAVRHGLSVL